jgi:uncharacterized membrane protein YphA (DoxX/SURF4 family)
MIQERPMRTTQLTTPASLAYWASTVLLAAACLLGGSIDVAHPPSAVAFLAHLGYPAYFAPMIGAWKILGGVAVLAPRFPRLKEWAYAGIFFDLTGAAISHAVTGDPALNVAVPVVLVGVAFVSWSLRPASRTLASAVSESKQHPGSGVAAHAVA